MLDSIEVVVKITERCNINCDYCYMFNRGNDDYKDRPPYMSIETATATEEFIYRGLKDTGAKGVSIVLHGGEPLMMKKDRFDEICSIFRRRLPAECKFRFGLQTNAMLIDDEWCEIFQRHKIGVGISIDGPRDKHDAHRVDHKGAGTYDKTIVGVRKLQEYVALGKLPSPGAICVISPGLDGKGVYRHLVDDLGFKAISLNLPMETHDTFRSGDSVSLGQCLVDAFNEWTLDDDPSIHVRIFEELMLALTGLADENLNIARADRKHILVLVAGDGEISEDDPYKVVNFAQRGGSVFSDTLKGFVESPLIQYIRSIPNHLADACHDCGWQNYCLGGCQHGLTINRFSSSNGFSNPSVLCPALKMLYAHVAKFILEQGMHFETMKRILDFSAFSERRLPLPRIPLGMLQIPISRHE